MIAQADGHDLKFTVEYLVFNKLDSSSETENDGRLTVSSYKLDHTPVKEGEKFSLTLTVKNSSSLACTHAVSVLDLSGAEGVSISGETDTKTLGNLNAGATTTVTYPLKCLSKMTTGSYPVAVSLSADDVTAASSKIYLPITGTKAGKDDTGEVGDSKPQLIIESYDFGGKAVTGGQEFNLVMNVRNTGSVPIDNCKMTVGSDTGDSDSDKSTAVGSVFTPSQSSNTFFIPSLGSNASVKKEIALLPKADAAPNSYGVIVNFSYDAVVDGKRQTLTSEETITIPLAQPIRFEVGDPVLSNPFYMGEAGQISIDYVNKGKSKVYNVSVELKGNFDTEESSQYIGNLDSGASDSFQANLTPQKEGSLSGTATFSYEDASGKVLTVAKDFSCDVQAAEAPTMGGADGLNPDGTPGANPEKTGPGWKLWAGIAASAAVVAAGIVFFLKKRKAKKMRLLEEAEDYDDTPGGGI
ncbi:COG1361 S-layer family protein [Caproicibacter fermentans]|uniref:Cell adhesion protein n=1 Tax=Caproicibacter fermentans TaxID=2576756 RepID=A0A7G8TEM6_9FIRM|nr:cell adhesion protein [Caproicibacter fermentans]QNK42067.1 cell adhesion protein [Caproicibacter fermentans]